MSKLNNFLIAVRKAQRQLIEKTKKMANPFEDDELNKKQVPQKLQYGDASKGGEHINIRKVEFHDEKDKEERRSMDKVRCFISNPRIH